MKVEVSDWQVKLRAENDEDKALLKKFAEEGIKIGHTGSTLGIHSPKISGEIAVYLNRDEQAFLAYAVGRTGLKRPKLRQGVLQQILPFEEQEPDWM